MWITGYIHQDENKSILGKVHIVPDLRFVEGEHIGWMELSNSNEIVKVKQNRAGFFHGQIISE